MRVRTIKRRPPSERWSLDSIQAIASSPRVPNPKDPRQAEPRPERLTKGIDPGGDGTRIPLDAPEDEGEDAMKVRDFRITRTILTKYGTTQGCQGCEAHNLGTGRRGHTHACRSRLEEEVKKDDVLRERVHAVTVDWARVIAN